MESFITRRKLAKAIKLAIEDHKIVKDAYKFCRFGGEILLDWPKLQESAPIRIRGDGTLYIGYASYYEANSYFAMNKVEWSPKQ